jgi:hypothetical protein
MSQRSTENLNTGLLTVTQTAVGCGIGLLIAGKLQRPTQKTTATTLLTIGALLAVPVVVGAVMKVWRGPESESGVRRRLDSIRTDSGLAEDAEIF